MTTARLMLMTPSSSRKRDRSLAASNAPLAIVIGPPTIELWMRRESMLLRLE